MTIQEFINWFEGYTEAVINRPTFEQWRVIRDKIASISTNDMYSDNNGISRRRSDVEALRIVK